MALILLTIGWKCASCGLQCENCRIAIVLNRHFSHLYREKFFNAKTALLF